MKGRSEYEVLLDAHNTAVSLGSEDFSSAAVVTEAEHAVRTVKAAEPKVLGFAEEIHDLCRAAYPATDFASFGDEPQSGDGVAKALNSDAKASDFRPAPYSLGQKETGDEHATSCSGKIINVPMVGLGENGCGLACEQTVFPTKCVAFASFKVAGSDDLCFLFSEVDDVETFTCKASFLQAKKAEDAGAVCKVKMSEITTGYKPKGELKNLNRCFGSGAETAVPQDLTSYSVPSGSDLTINDKVVLTAAQ